MIPAVSKSRILLATIVAVLVVLVWGETFVSSKIVLEHGFRPSDIFAFRFVIAYLGMWPISFRKRVCDSLKDEMIMLALGVTGGSLYFLAENTALAYSTASNTAIILSITPLATAIIMACFHKDERMNRRQAVGSLIAASGMVLIIFNGEVILKLNPLGDLLAFSAVLSWCLYSLLLKRVSGRYSTAFITRKVFGYGLLTIIPYFMATGWPNMGMAAISTPAVWGNVLYLGLVASLGCFLAWNWALKVAGTVRTTNLIYFQPFFTMLIGHIVLGERITLFAIAGSVILALGMYFAVKD